MFNPKSRMFPLLLVVVCGLIPAACAADTVGGNNAKARGRWDLLTEQYWRRIADSRNPAAPPRLVAINTKQPLLHTPQVAIVKAGDPLSVHSGAADSRVTLLATSLEGGVPGDDVRARIAVTGALVKVKIVDATSAVLMGLIRGRQ